MDRPETMPIDKEAEGFLRRMKKQGLIRRKSDGNYEITEAGKVLAQLYREQGA